MEGRQRGAAEAATMRQASWEELFRRVVGTEEAQPGFLSRLRSRFSFVSWEELVTLVIVLIGFSRSSGRSTAPTGCRRCRRSTASPSSASPSGCSSRTSVTSTSIVRPPDRPGGRRRRRRSYAIEQSLEGSLPDRARELVDRIVRLGRCAAHRRHLQRQPALRRPGRRADLPDGLHRRLEHLPLVQRLDRPRARRPGAADQHQLPARPERACPLLIYLFCAILLVARVNLLRHAA